MSIQRGVKNPWSKDFPYGCEIQIIPDELWQWIYSNVEENTWAWDVIFDTNLSDMSSGVWIGFQRQDDYTRFMLTWV